MEDTTLNSMEEITFENLLVYLENLPQEDSIYSSEEIRTEKVPDNWIKIGSLSDIRIGANFAMYNPWSTYALGFYPYSGCDIFKDDSGRIILSYIELGGHAPFRRNFFITKKSPFIFEPVSFDIAIEEDKIATFLANLSNYGLTLEKIEEDLKKYQSIDQIKHELNINETLVIRKYYNSFNKTYRYTMITKRENAIKLKADVGN